MGDISLDALLLRERELEFAACDIKARTLEIRSLIVEARRRHGGRPRKATAGLTVINEPTECDEQGPLPGIDDVRGILKTEEPAA